MNVGRLRLHYSRSGLEKSCAREKIVTVIAEFLVPAECVVDLTARRNLPGKLKGSVFDPIVIDELRAVGVIASHLQLVQRLKSSRNDDPHFVANDWSRNRGC